MSNEFGEFFAQVAAFHDALIRLQFARHRNETITLAEISAPGRDPKHSPYREVNPKSAEGQLLALGWRLVPVPWLYNERSDCSNLSWHHPAAWLAIAPADGPAARFDSRRAALWWAQEQVGLRPHSGDDSEVST